MFPPLLCSRRFPLNCKFAIMNSLAYLFWYWFYINSLSGFLIFLDFGTRVMGVSKLSKDSIADVFLQKPKIKNHKTLYRLLNSTPHFIDYEMWSRIYCNALRFKHRCLVLIFSLRIYLLGKAHSGTYWC